MLQTFADGVNLQETQQPVRTTSEVPGVLGAASRVIDEVTDLADRKVKDNTNAVLGRAALANLDLRRESFLNDAVAEDQISLEDARELQGSGPKAMRALERASANGLNNQLRTGMKRNLILRQMIQDNPLVDPAKLAARFNVSLSAEQLTLNTIREERVKELNANYTLAQQQAKTQGIDISGMDKKTAIDEVATHPTTAVAHTIARLKQKAEFNAADRAASQRHIEVASASEQTQHIIALNNVLPTLLAEKGGSIENLDLTEASAVFNQTLQRSLIAIDREYADWPEVAKARKDELIAHANMIRPGIEGSLLAKQNSLEQNAFQLKTMNSLNHASAELGIQLDNQKLVLNSQRMIQEEMNTQQQIMSFTPRMLKIKKELETGGLFGQDAALRDQALKTLDSGLENMVRFLRDTRTGQANSLLRYFNAEAANGRTISDTVQGMIGNLAAGTLPVEDQVFFVENLKTWADNALPGEKREAIASLKAAARNDDVRTMYSSSPVFRKLIPEIEEEVSKEVATVFQPMLNNLADRTTNFGLDLRTGGFPKLWTNVAPHITVDEAHLNKTGDVQYRLRDGVHRILSGEDIIALNDELQELNRGLVGRFKSDIELVKDMGNHSSNFEALEHIVEQNAGLSDLIQPQIRAEDVETIDDKIIDVLPEFIQGPLRRLTDENRRFREAEARRAQEELDN